MKQADEGAKMMMASTDITRAALAGDALHLLDTCGAESMSAESLADEAGLDLSDVHAVLNGVDPLDLACEAVYAQIKLAPDDRPWPARLRHNARSFRSVLVEHPSAVIPIATRPIVSNESMAIAESAITSLTEVGFDAVEANRVLLVIVNYVIGHSLSEVGVEQQLSHRSEVRDYRASLPADEMPLTAVALQEMPDRDAEFELGLKLIVDGLERRLLHS